MYIHHVHIPTKEVVTDALLFGGTIFSIFVFGLAALPWVKI